MALLVDSDILIDAGRSDSDAVSFLARLGQTDTLMISTITQLELMVGARNKNELRVIERFLARFTLVTLFLRK
jgi:predicted nucleic acid-binding protein